MPDFETVILVDENDVAVGECEKLEAHKKGLLHRAFSICLFNSKNEWLIHRRADSKYHCPGLWTNSCCSHPIPDLSIEESSLARLNYEMGLSADLTWVYSFRYRAIFENGLIEHEYDHVFVGASEDAGSPAPEEVSETAWISSHDLLAQIAATPNEFTPWFKDIVPELIKRGYGTQS